MKRFKFPLLLALFLLPALLVELGYILFINITDYLNLPNLNALALSALFIMVTVELGIIALCSKKELGHFSIKEMIKYTEPLSTKKYIIIIPILFLLTALIFILGKPVDSFIKESFFSFIPQRLIPAVNIENHTKPQLIVTVISAIFITGIIAPVVEEIYFRGFLLPRMEWMGIFAPLVNAVLFSLYHFWSPWQMVTRIIVLIPLCLIVYKKKNIKISIIVHCLLNIIGDGIGILIAII